jgi:hypothetical protein
MKHLVFGLASLGLAALLATAAQAQTQKVFRCVDARGATYYTEKAAPGCRPTRIESGQSTPAPAPAPSAGTPAAKANTAAPGVNVRRSFTPAPTAKAHCDGLANEAARLNAGKTSLVSSVADARLANIDKELARSCR